MPLLFQEILRGDEKRRHMGVQLAPGKMTMNNSSESPPHSCQMMADTASLSLAASAGCFVAASCGWVLNQFVSDAIGAEGFFIVGCFYLTIGTVNYSRMRWLDSPRHQAEKPGDFYRRKKSQSQIQSSTCAHQSGKAKRSLAYSEAAIARVDCHLSQGPATLCGNRHCLEIANGRRIDHRDHWKSSRRLDCRASSGGKRSCGRSEGQRL